MTFPASNPLHVADREDRAKGDRHRKGAHATGDVPAPTLDEFLALPFKPREFLLEPIVPTQGLAMISAWRGTGKTQVGIGATLAVATGTSFLKYTAPKPRRALYVDGELPATLLQQMFRDALKRLPGNVAMPSPDFLRIITPDMMPDFAAMPDLNTEDGQRAIETHLEGVELLALDTVSTLFRSGSPENEEHSWRDAQDWLLKHRRRGVSTLLFHHEGKGGMQRGTSKREDVLDTSISLKRPKAYSPQEGARFEVHITKGRTVWGDAALPFEARLQGDVWTMQSIEERRVLEAHEMRAGEATLRDIEKATGISKSRLQRLFNSGATKTA